MPDSIDHLVIACSDPDSAAAEIELRLGLRATGAGRHTALGTFNRLIWLGDTFIELIGIEARKLAEASWIGRPVVAAAAAGGGVATWAAATSRIVDEVQTLRARGSAIELPSPGERVRPDGRIVRWALAVAPPLGPVEPPFLIQHDLGAAEWSLADRAERDAERHPIGGTVRFEILEVPTADVPRATRACLRTLGIGPFRPSLAGHGARDASIGPHAIRFVPSSTEGWPVATLHLRAGGLAGQQPDVLRDIELFGCRWLILAGQA